MTIILLMALMLMLAVSSRKDNSRYDDPFVNEEGDHSYYNRGLIEKKEFHRRHPDIKGVRTFRRLFGHKPEDKI